MSSVREIIEAQERADVLRKMARREDQQRRRHREFMTMLVLLAGLVILILIFGLRLADACEIACGPVFTQCLLDAGTAETPEPRVERECRRIVQADCIRPCRKEAR